jgi:23S rRNA pseudouridine1911/1915/1917 synthase
MAADRDERDSPISIRVPDDAEGERLDRFLAAVLGSRTRAQSLISASRVRVDGRARPKRHAVRAGEVIEVHDPPEEPAPEQSDSRGRIEIAYQDDDLLVVDKPAGMVVHPARGNRTGTLAQALRGMAMGGEDPWRAGIVHRLDRDTSGLLVVARSEDVHRALRALLAARQLHREYLTLVEGRLEARSGTIDAPIGRDRRDRLLVSIDTDVPREARTHFRLERVLPATSLLRAQLETGRTHQIRVHMASIGHPVVGDRQYGGRETYGLTRQFLHATRLRFPHPVTGEEVDVQSPLPEDLAAALEKAEAESAPRSG